MMPEISLPIFKGPLDLLLHLIERDDLDITTVSLVAITDQYMRTIHAGQGLDARVLADFVAIGAKLIYLKSRALLPRIAHPEGEAVDDDDDAVGQELVDLLVEYRRFTEVTDLLEKRQEDGIRVYSRIAAPLAPSPTSGLEGVTIDALARIMRDVLKRTEVAPRSVLPRDTVVTLSQRIEELRSLLRRGERFSFREAIEICRTRLEVVISFLAVLELIKAGECDALQPGNWGDIEVRALRRPAAVRS